jgi:predicted nucleic acid-binding protein
VIFVDSNLFVIDLRYPRDPAHGMNRRALERLARDGTGVTSLLNLLEVCGILSFNLSSSALHALYVHFERRYGVTVLPGGGEEARLPAPSARDVLARMEGGMALKDAEIALVAEQHVATLSVFLSWNAKHFAGRLPVPALTPRQWLAQLRRADQA